MKENKKRNIEERKAKGREEKERATKNERRMGREKE